MAQTIGAAKFKATCLQVLDGLSRGGEPVTITKRGKPIAVLAPVGGPEKPPSLFGSMKTEGFRFDDPFSPVSDISEWDAGG